MPQEPQPPAQTAPPAECEAICAHSFIGTVRLARAAARFGGGAAPTPGAAPHLGEHSREVLAELGCDALRIDLLLGPG